MSFYKSMQFWINYQLTDTEFVWLQRRNLATHQFGHRMCFSRTMAFVSNRGIANRSFARTVTSEHRNQRDVQTLSDEISYQIRQLEKVISKDNRKYMLKSKKRSLLTFFQIIESAKIQQDRVNNWKYCWKVKREVCWRFFRLLKVPKSSKMESIFDWIHSVIKSMLFVHRSKK